jgi:hypothetical protein
VEYDQEEQIKIQGKRARYIYTPFNFVDTGEVSYLIFSIKKAKLKQAGDPVFGVNSYVGWKGYPLILTRQLTSQATKGRDGS